MPKSPSEYCQSERLFLLYDFLMRNGSPKTIITKREIMEYLEDYNISIHDNTLYSDMKKLRDGIYHVNWEYIDHEVKVIDDAGHISGGYRVYNPTFEAHELRYITDSIQASKFLTQAEAQRLTRKITSLSSKKNQKSLNVHAVVVDRVRSMNDSAVKDADKIYQAISTNKKIAFKVFHYKRDGKKEYSRNGKPYIVSPYSTLWHNGYYYLYAFVDGENRFRYFRIDRMESISNPLLESREGKEQYDAKNLNRKAVKVFAIKDGKETQVKICFNNGLVDAVRDQFGKDVMMIPQDEKSFSVNVNVRLSSEFYAWLFNFGRGAKIISPPEVAAKMLDYAEKIVEMYKNNGEM